MKFEKYLKNEIDLIASIEKKLGRENLTKEELDFLIDEAEKGTPRQEFNYGLYIYFETRNEEESIVWFEKALNHMNGYALLRCSGVIASLGDEWEDLSMKFLRRAAWRQNPIAKRMLKFMKEHPFKYPEA